MTNIDVLLILIAVFGAYWFGVWSTTRRWMEIVESHKRTTALWQGLYERENELVCKYLKEKVR